MAHHPVVGLGDWHETHRTIEAYLANRPELG
jgi:hypothetical protein